MRPEPNTYGHRTDHSFQQMQRPHVGSPSYQQNCHGKFLHARELGEQWRSAALTLGDYGELHFVCACGYFVYGLKFRRCYWWIKKKKTGTLRTCKLFSIRHRPLQSLRTCRSSNSPLAPCRVGSAPKWVFNCLISPKSVAQKPISRLSGPNLVAKIKGLCSIENDIGKVVWYLHLRGR